MLELNKEEYATEEDKSYRIDYWAKLFKATTWEELKQLATEFTDLQSTVEVFYRVSADEQARAEIIARERFLRDQHTQQSIMQRLNDTLAKQEQTISEQAAEIARLRAENAALKKQAN